VIVNTRDHRSGVAKKEWGRGDGTLVRANGFEGEKNCQRSKGGHIPEGDTLVGREQQTQRIEKKRSKKPRGFQISERGTGRK